jgi:hypothetical protein
MQELSDLASTRPANGFDELLERDHVEWDDAAGQEVAAVKGNGVLNGSIEGGAMTM